MPLWASYAIADLIGEIWYLASPRLRRVLDHNLSLIPRGAAGDRDSAGGGDTGTAGGRESAGGVAGRDSAGRGGEGGRSRRRLARRIARNFGRVVTEFLYLPRLGPANLRELVDIESFEPIKEYAARPGAVFATAHLGNWELAGAMLSMLGIDLTVIVYDDPDPRVARLFRERREAKGVRVVPVKASAKELTSAVRDTSLGVVADRDFSGRGMAATFLGVDVRMPFAYAGLAVARGMPVVFGVCVKLNDGKYHLMVEGPIYGDSKDPGSSRKVAEECIRNIEKYVEKYPEQWYLFEKIGGELA